MHPHSTNENGAANGNISMQQRFMQNPEMMTGESGPGGKISVVGSVSMKSNTIVSGSKRQASSKENNNGASLSQNPHDSRGFVEMKFINKMSSTGSNFVPGSSHINSLKSQVLSNRNPSFHTNN